MTATGPRDGSPHSVRIHPSLVRPVLIGGAEREPMVVVLGLVAALVTAFRPNLVTYSLAALLILVGLPRLRRLARRDPQFFAVLRRHVHVAGYYPARPVHCAPRRRVPTL
jgi:type IV secretory pathway TrbD component